MMEHQEGTGLWAAENGIHCLILGIGRPKSQNRSGKWVKICLRHNSVTYHYKQVILVVNTCQTHFFRHPRPNLPSPTRERVWKAGGRANQYR